MTSRAIVGFGIVMTIVIPIIMGWDWFSTKIFEGGYFSNDFAMVPSGLSSFCAGKVLLKTPEWQSLKPWPNGLASQRKFLTCVQLAWTPVQWLWSSLNSYASRCTFFTVWPPNASRHKLIASQLYMREIYDFLQPGWTCEPTCESVWPPITSLYASSGFANFRRLASTCESVWPGL